MKTLVVLSGAGISAESGLKTFRDSDGLWENHNIYEVATPEAWQKNPNLVQSFYNARRRQLATVKPNSAHTTLAQLQKEFEVIVITQNIDDLHERGGSKNVLHLHGELVVGKSSKEDAHYKHLGYEDINMGDKAADGSQLRPHVVWFGEAVPKLDDAAHIMLKADIVLVIGTSLQVYPANTLLIYAEPTTPTYIIDPQDIGLDHKPQNVTHIKKTAVNGIKIFEKELYEKFI